MGSNAPELRLLIVPGLHGSSVDHWQSRLEREHPGAVRVTVPDWSQPDLDTWANAIGQTLAAASQAEAEPLPHSCVAEPLLRSRVADPLLRWRRAEEPTRPAITWVAVAHSYGCLALAHYLLRGSQGIASALLVAPANPDRFDIPDGQLDRSLPLDTTLVFSRNDPWMSEADARYLGRRWGSTLVDAGEAGHINPSSGHGSFPLARLWVAQQVQVQQQRHRPASLRPRLLDAARSARRFAV